MLLRDQEVLSEDNEGGGFTLDEVEDIDCDKLESVASRSRRGRVEGLTSKDPRAEQVGGVTRSLSRPDVSEREHVDTVGGASTVGSIDGEEYDPCESHPGRQSTRQFLLSVPLLVRSTTHMGKNISTMSQRNLTKQYASNPFFLMISRESALRTAGSHESSPLGRGSTRFLRGVNNRISSWSTSARTHLESP